MGKETGITWCDHTFNPWWGCIKVSEGCTHCYAETFATQRMGLPIWGPVKTTSRRTWAFDSKHWNEPHIWNARAAMLPGRNARVFSGSMCDILEDHPQVVESRAVLWAVIKQTPFLTWQLLTKRPENARAMFPEQWWREGFPPNAWVGTSIEDERVKDERLLHLIQIPARVLWLSCEPLIGPLDLENTAIGNVLLSCDCGEPACTDRGISWIVAGGESGPGHRPMDMEWPRSLLRQARNNGAAFFFKQVGGHTPKAGGDLLDGVEYKEFPSGA